MSIARRKVTGKGAEERPLVIRYTGRDGKRHQETIKSGLKKDAARRLREIEIEKEHGIHVPKSQTENMAFLFKLWLDHYELLVNRGIKARSTFDGYKRDVELHLLPEFGGTLITRFEALYAQHFVDQMMSKSPLKRDGSGKREHGRRYSLSRLRIITIPLKLALDFAVDHKLAGRNVLKDRPIRFPEMPSDEREWMDLEDGRKVLVALDRRKANGVKGDDNALLWRNQAVVILIMMFCGLREAEACGTQWEDIDLTERILHVRHQVERGTNRITTRLKSKSAKRSIPINEILYQALIKHAPRVEDRFGCVVKNTRGGVMATQTVIMTIIPKIMERAGLVKKDGSHRFTAHQLRHFAGSIWLAEGMPLDEVSRLMGHSRIETTRKTYIHQLQHDTRAREALERVSSLFTGRPVPDALPSAPGVPLRLEHQQPGNQAAVADANGMEPVVMATDNGPAAPLDFSKGLRELQREHALSLWPAHSTREIAKMVKVSQMAVAEWIQEAHGNLKRRVLRTRRYENRTPEETEEINRKQREAYRRRRGLSPERIADLDRSLPNRGNYEPMTPEQIEEHNRKLRGWYRDRRDRMTPEEVDEMNRERREAAKKKRERMSRNVTPE
jgi:integrase